MDTIIFMSPSILVLFVVGIFLRSRGLVQSDLVVEIYKHATKAERHRSWRRGAVTLLGISGSYIAIGYVGMYVDKVDL